MLNSFLLRAEYKGLDNSIELLRQQEILIISQLRSNLSIQIGEIQPLAVKSHICHFDFYEQVTPKLEILHIVFMDIFILLSNNKPLYFLVKPWNIANSNYVFFSCPLSFFLTLTADLKDNAPRKLPDLNFSRVQVTAFQPVGNASD